MAICGTYMKQKGTLKKNTIVVTVMTNLGFSLMGEREGIHVEKTKVGDRYVLENMREHGYNIGGEQSGHVIFLDDNTTGDGLLSALHLLEVMVKTKKTLSELASVMEVLPQALVNAKVPNHKKDNFMDYQEIADADVPTCALPFQTFRLQTATIFSWQPFRAVPLSPTR